MGALARGTLYFMIVQLVFMASGYIIHAGLGRLLGPSAYGIFGVVISLMTLGNVLLVTGVPMAGSRFIAIANESIGAIKRATVNLQVVLSLVVFALYFLLSPVIAGMLGDPSLSGYLRASAFVIPVYALNSLYGGFLNGLRMYGRQGAVQFFSSIAKVVGAIGLVLIGFGIYGAIAGYFLGSLVGLVIGWYYLRDTGKDSNPGNFPYRKIIDFAYPVIIFSFALLFLMSIDLFLVKRILGEDVQVGYYTAASTLSKMPYYILTGLGVALFPAISKSSAVQTGKYIRESMRYLMLLLLPAVFIISGSSEALVALLYSERFAPASLPLAILVFGVAAFTLFSILTTVINASGTPRVSMMIAVVLIPLAAILNRLLIPAYQLEGAAIATTITGFIGLVIASMYVLRVFGVLMEPVSFLKMLFASLIVFAIALSVPVSGLLIPFWYAFLFALYLCILALVKELNKKDLETLTSILATEQKSNICVEGCSSSAADKYISAQTNNSYRVEGAEMKLKHKWQVLIPVVIFVYLIYVNLLPFGGTAVYSIDVGADDLQGKAKLTGPMDRISEPNDTNGTTFRDLQAGLVYFDLKSPYLSPYLKDRGEVTVKVLFRDNFTENQKFMIGAKNNMSWSYAWKEIYVPFYEALKEYPSVKLGNKRVIMISASEISGLDYMPEGSVIATNTKIDLKPYVDTIDYANTDDLSINVALRGSHTFYTYVDDGALALSIAKQDLNWYNGTDELKIEVYSDKNELIGNGTIPDDGEQNKTNVLGSVQKAAFSFSDLDKGIYRLELILGVDLLIREIDIDRSKLVTEGKLFLVGDNRAYFKGTNATPVEVYFKNPRNSTMRFQTWHDAGLQNITVNGDNEKVFNINETKTIFNLSLGPSNDLDTLISEKGDVIIDSINYFSFTEDSYFIPKKFKIIDIKPDLTWLKDNVDYVVLEYDFTEGGDWKSGNASWDLEDLYIKDNTLSFCFNVPHLGKEEFRNYTIPVDRIEIEVRTPPIWERGR